jgi:hypothetical protein
MQTLSKKYIRVLVNSLCQSCYIDAQIFKFGLFQKFCPVLIKFVNKNKTLESEILNTISEFTQKNTAPGTEKILANILCDCNLVTNGVYQKWLRNSNRTKTETAAAAAPSNNSRQKENKLESVINPILSLEQKFEKIFKEKLIKNEKIFNKIKV